VDVEGIGKLTEMIMGACGKEESKTRYCGLFERDGIKSARNGMSFSTRSTLMSID
jgi:hypothetical protein